MTAINQLLDRCERMAQHSFVREALDLINEPFQEVDCNKDEYIRAAKQSVKVNHRDWSYVISGNLPDVLNGMKNYSVKSIKFNKFTTAINELYFLNMLQGASIDKDKYLIFAYGRVPDYQSYQLHFRNRNDGYIMCARPLAARDVIGLAERIKQHLPDK